MTTDPKDERTEPNEALAEIIAWARANESTGGERTRWVLVELANEVERLTSFERAAKESVEIMRRAHAEEIARLTAERDAALHHAGEWLVSECEAQTQVAKLENERDAALGSERILSQMLGECAQLLGLDAAKNSPKDIAPTIEVWRENISTLRAELSKAQSQLSALTVTAS